jgi:hypothetical protein
VNGAAVRCRAGRLLGVLVFALASVPSLWAQIDPVTKVPVDVDLNWTVGLAQFQAVNLSKENLYLASSFPLQIREKLIGYKNHQFPAEEIDSLKKMIVNSELKKEIGNLLAMQKTRDDALFLESKDFQKKKINDDYLKNSAPTRDRIAFLRALDPQTVAVKPEKPIALKDNSGQLFPAPPFSALRYCDEIDVDALLWGTVEEIQGYLYCEVYLFDRILEKNIFLFKEAGQPQELFASLAKAVPALVTAVVGREWADLLIDVTPAFSFIKINGVLAGMGTVEIQDQPPGFVTLQIESPGYEDRKEKVELKNLERSVFQYELVKSEEEFLLIDTVPPAADAYFNSLWIGKTPLVVEKPNLLTRLALRSPGFQDLYARLGPDSPTTLNFALLKTVIDFDKLKDSKRWRYYTSLAAFVLSVPFPMFSFGLMRDYYDARKMGEYEFFSATYYWTFFITGALFVNMMYDLFLYLNSRSETVG